MIRVDQAKFGQVLRNLLSNALKFTPRAGSVTVLLEAVRATNEAAGCDSGALAREQRRGLQMFSLQTASRVAASDVVVSHSESWSLRVSVKDTGAGISEVKLTAVTYV